MGGLLLLLALCGVMAVASFLAGALPLSMSLSQSQLRLLSSIGVGVLVGTSLIIIIPEGIEAVSAASETSHSHRLRALAPRSLNLQPRIFGSDPATMRITPPKGVVEDTEDSILSHIVTMTRTSRRSTEDEVPSSEPVHQLPDDDHSDEHKHTAVPTAEIGISLILGFILMFLIDRIPKHATESLHGAPQTQHMSLDNLGGNDSAEEAEGFLTSLRPSPKQSRSLATTLGLVIHAAADGIAMGASSTTSDQKLGLIIFVAIMIHKAPAAFGLTSVLLKQGLSKRAARTHLVVFSLAAPVGAVATWLLITVLGGGGMDGPDGQRWTGMLLLFSGGTFLYVAMHAMNEDAAGHEHGTNGYVENTAQRKQQGPQMRDTLATMGGMLLPLLTQLGGHHH